MEPEPKLTSELLTETGQTLRESQELLDQMRQSIGQGEKFLEYARKRLRVIQEHLRDQLSRPV